MSAIAVTAWGKAFSRNAACTLFLTALVCGSCTSTRAPSALYPVRRNGYCGFMDGNGKIVIPLEFDEVRPFEEERAVVQVRGKYGYIDRTGKLVIPARYRWANDFSDGLALVWRELYEGRYVDKNGREVTWPALEIDSFFSEGLAAVWVDKKEGYVDKKGRIVIKPQFDWAGMFSEGLALVRVGGTWNEEDQGYKGSRYVYINRKGEVVLDPKVDEARRFHEGLAAVRVGRKWGFVDRKGKYAIPPKFDQVWELAEGLAAAEKGNTWGYIDRNGRFVIKPRFGCVYSFSEGLAAFVVDGKFGYIDKGGKIVIPARFDAAGEFCQGLAPVQIGHKCAYIDKRGEFVFKPDNPQKLFAVVPWSGSPVPDGVAREYHDNGNIKSETIVENGCRNGTARDYNEKGILVFEGTYTNDFLDGVARWYYPTGELRSENTFDAESREGPGRQYNREGEVIAELIYKDDERHEGTYFKYKEPGYIPTPEEHRFDEWHFCGTGGPPPDPLTYAKEAAILTYRKGEIVRVQSADLDGRITRKFDFQYKDNEPHGPCVSWNRKGEEVARCVYRNGEPFDGKALRIFEPEDEGEAAPTNAAYYNSIDYRWVRSTYMIHYHEGRVAKAEACDVDGKPTGRFVYDAATGEATWRDASGKVIASAVFKDNEPENGVVFGYDSRGFYLKTYKQGWPASRIACDENGRPLPVDK